VEFRVRLDEPRDHLPNPIKADQRFAGRSDKSSVRFIQRHNLIEITGVQMLLEDPWPVFGIVWQHGGNFSLTLDPKI